MKSSLYSGGQALASGFGDAELQDPALLDLIAGYKRRVAGNYRPLSPHDIEGLAAGKMTLSEKIDGELWFMVGVGKEVFLTNAKGRVLAGDLPFLPKSLPAEERCVVAGELHAKVEGRRCRVGDLAAALADGKNARVAEVCFSAFDLVEDAGAAPPAAYEARHARLLELLPSSPNLRALPIEAVGTGHQVRQKYEAQVATGLWEGIVLRLETGLIHKLKPSITVDVALIGYTVKADRPELARSVLLGLVHEDGVMQIIGACGNLGSDEDRRGLLSELLKLKTESSVRYASDTGGLYNFVRPEMVAEISATDFQGEQSDGKPITGMTLRFGPEGWSGLGLRPAPKPIHPVLVRIRRDKKADPTDARFAQVVPYLPERAEAEVIKGAVPGSTMIRREVWTKEAKGQTAVRKLIIWQTNKAAVDRRFPAYVVHWTDYSPTRAEPLDRDVRIAPSEEVAVRIADGLVEENIKKGWNKV